MKTSNWIWFGLAGTALVLVAARLLRRQEIAFAADDLFLDTDFIPGNGKFTEPLASPDNPHWFKTQQRSLEDSDALFI